MARAVHDPDTAPALVYLLAPRVFALPPAFTGVAVLCGMGHREVAEMERVGIAADTDYLSELEAHFAAEVKAAQQSAHDRLFQLFKASDEANLRRNPIQALFRGDGTANNKGIFGAFAAVVESYTPRTLT